MKRLLVLVAVALPLFACTPNQRQAWIKWHNDDPKAAEAYARKGCPGANGCRLDSEKNGTTSSRTGGSSNNNGGGSSSGYGKWDPILQCESNGNWHATEGHFEGGLQFEPSTWRAYGGTQYAAHAYDATPAQQIAIAEKVLAEDGWVAWPTCSRRAGYR